MPCVAEEAEKAALQAQLSRTTDDAAIVQLKQDVASKADDLKRLEEEKKATQEEFHEYCTRMTCVRAAGARFCLFFGTHS